jgi:hypothetical protein
MLLERAVLCFQLLVLQLHLLELRNHACGSGVTSRHITWGSSKRPFLHCLAQSVVRQQVCAGEQLVRERRRLAGSKPLLDGRATVGMPVGTNDRVIHSGTRTLAAGRLSPWTNAGVNAVMRDAEMQLPAWPARISSHIPYQVPYVVWTYRPQTVSTPFRKALNISQ